MFTDRKERKKEKRKKKLEFLIKRRDLAKASMIACHDFVVVGQRIESLEKIRNEDDIIFKNKDNKIDINPLRSEAIKLEEQFEKTESVYLKKTKDIEMEFGKPLSYIKV